jgi:hypothetical protein
VPELGGSGGIAGGGTTGNGGTPGSGGGIPETGGALGTGGGGGGTGTGPFPPVTDFAANGPFTATTVNATGPRNGYTIYAPTELAPNGAKNPIVAWMSGGGTGPNLYTLLPHLATHGFFVIASNTIPGAGTEVALGQELVQAIDWAIAENARSGSTYFGKLDENNVAAMGYSMGSLATFTMASDPRLTTTVHISGGNFMPDRVQNLREPAAFFCGTPGDATCNLLSATCDIAAANCDVDFRNATTPVFYGNFTGGHLGVLSPPLADQIRSATTAWLRWKLMADSTIAARLVGPSCTLCSDPAWKVQQKNL